MKFQSTLSCPKSLLTEIENQRNQLLKIAKELGFNHRKTVHSSQELDKLINRYYQITR